MAKASGLSVDQSSVWKGSPGVNAGGAGNEIYQTGFSESVFSF